jgi:cephalosporin-C deacetylase
MSLLLIYFYYYLSFFFSPQHLKIEIEIGEGNFQKSPFIVYVSIQNLDTRPAQYDLKGGLVSLDKKNTQYFQNKVWLNAKEKKKIPLQFSLKYPNTYFLQLNFLHKQYKPQKDQILLAYQLEKFNRQSNTPMDLLPFWKEIREKLNTRKPEFQVTPFPKYSNHLFMMYRVEMMAYDDLKLVGWYRVPKKAKKVPAILQLPPLGGKFNRVYTLAENELYGIPPEYAVLSLNIRNHGKSDTIYKTNNFNDLIAYNIEEKKNYFYAGAIADAWRGLDFLAQRNEVDKDKIITEGASQGGGLALWLASLDDRVAITCPDVMFLGDWEELYETTYWVKQSVQQWSRKKNVSIWQIRQNLRYFDLKNIAHFIKIPVLMSAGLQDWTCPPQAIRNVFNKIASQDKSFILYPKGKHEGGGKAHRRYKFQWLKEKLQN